MAKESGLLYVPVLHTPQEARGIGHTFQSGSAYQVATANLGNHDQSVREMWAGIARKLNEANLSWPMVRVYQDALPVCGMENEIISVLADHGSLNHQLLMDLVGRGARLEGTEDPDLLVQEHEYLTALIATSAGRPERAAFEEYQVRGKALMEKRDAFIAARIRSTIREGELPLVFMGVRHQLDKQLDGDFMITYLIYRLPFRKIGDIYNV